MDLSDASEKVPSDTTGDRSWDLPTSSAALPQICTDVKDDLLYGYYIDCCFLFGVYDVLWDNLLLRCLVVIVLTCFDFKIKGGFDSNSANILKIKLNRNMSAKISAKEEGETNSRNNVHIELTYVSARAVLNII